jgi:DNA helicase II / ATP-dependent DNA helicase PcrA
VRYFADLHVHSRFSRATSKQCDLPHLAQWACKKGLALVATGDFTHPGWRAELREQLVPAGPGVFQLRDDLQRAVDEEVPPSCRAVPRFTLSVEISTIYKKGDRTRKVHHVVYAPDFETAENLVEKLERIGNLHSDGRPILGLDSRDLLEMVLESGPDAYLVPAHVWTPWFAAMGSKSGFDSVDECYGDLAEHIFAVETGLSSDPPMNWRVPTLDRFRLVSNSDAHSPAMLGRNACCFDADVDYFAVRRALSSGEGYVGTVDMYPEEGKYHLDGHRKCGVRLEPRETLAAGGRCPGCGRPLTVGVMHRVELLADREEGCAKPATGGELCYLIPLTEILSELLQVGPKSKKVTGVYERLLRRLGPELPLLTRTPAEELRRAESPLLARAVTRLRKGRVIREAGYDGEFGTIRLFEDGEVDRAAGGELLFELPKKKKKAPVRKVSKSARGPAAPVRPERTEAVATPESDDPLDALDADQRIAAEVVEGPLLIIAGPGSGKTRTLTHRIAHLITGAGAEPEECLAITFTRRAAQEMRERLEALIPEVAPRVPVHTFHGLGLTLLQQHAADAGLPEGFRVADEAERVALLVEQQSLTETRARRLLRRFSTARRGGDPDGDLAGPLDAYLRGLRDRGWVDFDDLNGLAVELLEGRPGVAEAWRSRHPHLSIDEYQDVDALQVRLVRALAPTSSRGSVCAIGDPDQAIYGFRGSDVRYFEQFAGDFPGTREFRLSRNYRSSGAIAHGAAGMIGEGDRVERRVEVMLEDPERISLHEAPTSKAESEFVVVTLERILGGHSFFSRDSGRGDHADLADLSFSDVGVLYRTEAQAGDLVEALARSGMPFQRHTHEPLAGQPGVAELVEVLRAEPPAGAVVELLDRASRDDDELATAAALLRPLARSCGADLPRFLTEIALGAAADCWDPRADRISLLTLHAAKGLQFDVVFVVGCSDGLLPLSFGPRAAAGLDEERRLFYVGMTRARRRLLLCRAKRARHLGKVRELPPSPFLLDIEQRLLQRRESTAKRKKKPPADDQMKLF